MVLIFCELLAHTDNNDHKIQISAMLTVYQKVYNGKAKVNKIHSWAFKTCLQREFHIVANQMGFP